MKETSDSNGIDGFILCCDWWKMSHFYRISEYKKIYQFNNYIDGVEYYKNVYWDDLWQAYSPDKREGLINGLAETFNNADIVFVPETSSCIDNYANVYNLYREHNITMKIIKENLYKFEVIKKIKESDNCNVLVLKRLWRKFANLEGINQNRVPPIL